MADQITTHPPEDSWFDLWQIYGALNELTGRTPNFTVRRMVELAASDRVPLTKRNGKWGTPKSNLPAVATALGLMAVQPVMAASKRQRRTNNVPA